MKRVVAIILAVVLAFSMVTLVACAGSCEACGETSGVRKVSVEGDREALCNECIRDFRQRGFIIK